MLSIDLVFFLLTGTINACMVGCINQNSGVAERHLPVDLIALGLQKWPSKQRYLDHYP